MVSHTEEVPDDVSFPVRVIDYYLVSLGLLGSLGGYEIDTTLFGGPMIRSGDVLEV